MTAQDAEEEAHRKDNVVDFENLLKHYPTKFDVSKCLSADRTFPACKSSIKAPVELESHLQLIRNQIIPASKRDKTKKANELDQQFRKTAVSVNNRRLNQTQKNMVSVIDDVSIHGGLQTGQAKDILSLSKMDQSDHRSIKGANKGWTTRNGSVDQEMLASTQRSTYRGNGPNLTTSQI